MAKTIAEQLASHFVDFRYDTLTPDTRKAVKRLLLDYLGVGVAGSQTGSGKIAREFAASTGGYEQATLLGDGRRVPAMQAALANAISSHSVELDDIDVLALFHFSPPVYSAALATAEQKGKDGRALVAALAAGCEMMERLSKAANNSLRNRAYHTTPTCGIFGAAVASGFLLDNTAEQVVSALGLAGAQSGGLMEMYGPSMQKRFNPGPASRSGVTAAAMANLGFTGAATIFEGERGWLRAFTDASDPSQLTLDLDKPYQLDIEFKPYSCARPIHNAIDCALDIRKKHAPDLNRIKRMTMARHPDWALYHQNARPQTYHEAQVSLPYSVAVAFTDGQALFPQYNNARLEEPMLVKLSEMLEITVDDTLPRGVSCRLTVEMDDGARHVSQVDYPKGSIQNSMSDAELRAKFDSLTIPVIGASRSAEAAAMVADIEQCKDAGQLMRLLSPAGN
ncbi:MmgE/PrpD family protein [Achromobacter denitrificans]|uniref:MmgE/PrpD family protein n=1 Tax=Achromobacter denitrificans TaxID=32002 RepID=UPI000F667802|nr:MmgE/PrpD family protein [Achromobacter denitrificans]RSE81785.1 MmgE/PrpD family protein [Achromobacter denitrificans]